MKETRLN